MRTEADNGIGRFDAKQFRERLARWHRNHRRPFPWRTESDPWIVLATEMLLRRTRAEAVSRIWPSFVRSFPSPEVLVHDQEAARELLAPLGLRWRVENLIALADRLVKDYGGEIPENDHELLRLPGVGQYVVAAVRLFARRGPAVLVDTNTARVAARVLYGSDRPGPLRTARTRSTVSELVGGKGGGADLNLAILDLAGMVCKPRAPRCHECPVVELCTYAASRGLVPSPSGPGRSQAKTPAAAVS